MKIFSVYYEDFYQRSFSTRELAEQFIATILINDPEVRRLDYWISEVPLDEMN